MFRSLALIAVLSLAFTAPARADDQDDRARKAKAAVAVARSLPTSLPAIAAAPAPRVVEPKNYADGHKESVSDQAVLVVYVACDGPRIEGAITCSTPAPTFGKVQGPAVVVGYPSGGVVMIDSTLPCPADPKDVKRAVEKAAKKIDTPPAKQMPAPAPLNTQISAVRAACICGDGCQCPPGSCPGKCPVIVGPVSTPAKSEPVIVGYTYTRVCNGNGTCRIVQTPVYR